MRKPVDKQDLKLILTDYFRGNSSKPIAILSKIHSGRTSLIKETAAELGVEKDLDIISCYSTAHVERYDCTFDDLMEEAVAAYAATEKKFLVIEVTADAFIGNNPYLYQAQGWSSTVKPFVSDKYNIIPYFPKFEEWMEWAKCNSQIEDITLSFAKKYPVLYHAGARYAMVYMHLNDIVHNAKNANNPEYQKLMGAIDLSAPVSGSDEWKEKTRKELLFICSQLANPCERYLVELCLKEFCKEIFRAITDC